MAQNSVDQDTKDEPNNPNDDNEFMSQFQQMPTGKRNQALSSAIAFCEKNHPRLVEGYRRNEHASGETAKGYLEMILKAYISKSIKNKAA